MIEQIRAALPDVPVTLVCNGSLAPWNMDMDDPWSLFPPKPDDPEARCTSCDYEGPWVDSHERVECEAWPVCDDLTRGGTHTHVAEGTGYNLRLVEPS